MDNIDNIIEYLEEIKRLEENHEEDSKNYTDLMDKVIEFSTNNIPFCKDQIRLYSDIPADCPFISIYYNYTNVTLLNVFDLKDLDKNLDFLCTYYYIKDSLLEWFKQKEYDIISEFIYMNERHMRKITDSKSRKGLDPNMPYYDIVKNIFVNSLVQKISKTINDKVKEFNSSVVINRYGNQLWVNFNLNKKITNYRDLTNLIVQELISNGLDYQLVVDTVCINQSITDNVLANTTVY